MSGSLLKGCQLERESERNAAKMTGLSDVSGVRALSLLPVQLLMEQPRGVKIAVKVPTLAAFNDLPHYNLDQSHRRPSYP